MLQSRLKVGELDTRIVIERLTNTPDNYNQPVPTWSTFATVWAKLEDRSGSERYQADQLTAWRHTVFIIRYLSGMRETMRIRYNNRIYNIRFIESHDRKRSLEVGTDLLDDPEVLVGGAFSDGFSSGFST